MFDCELIGLPGAGISRLGRLSAPTFSRLTVIDIRSPLPENDLGQSAEDFLVKAVSASHAIVFQFMEQADLLQQAYWQQWCQSHASGLPLLRAFQNQLPADWHQKLHESPLLPAPKLDLQTFEFSLPRVSLEHLLFGLDASKQNLGMKLFRVKGEVQTIEYENPVAIEGTFNRWDTYGGEGLKLGWLKIQGQGLEQARLEELLQAAYI